MATGTSGDERDDELTNSNGDALDSETTDETAEAQSTESSDVEEADAADDGAEHDEGGEAEKAVAVKSKTKTKADDRKKSGKTASRREAEAEKKKRKQKSENRLARFFREVIAELKKVVTPTRKELWRYVGVVLGFLVIVMALVALLDFLFNYAASWVFGTGTELGSLFSWIGGGEEQPVAPTP